VMVHASEDVIIISGVLSFGGFLISFAEITGAVVSVVVLSVGVDLSLSLVVEVVEEPLSLLLHEMTVRQKKYGENDEYMFHLVSYWCIRRTKDITPIGLFYKNWIGSAENTKSAETFTKSFRKYNPPSYFCGLNQSNISNNAQNSFKNYFFETNISFIVKIHTFSLTTILYWFIICINT